MRKILTIICLLAAITAAAVTGRLYKGTSTSYSNIAYTIDDRHIYRGTSTSYSNIVYTYDSRHIYRGTSTSCSNIVYTFDR